MAVEMEHTYAAYALPTPTDTPYRTPSRGLSRRSSRHGSASPAMSSSPPPLPPGGDSYFNGHEGESGIDDKISPLDPRRFTPTLHANLVSEILSLRREVESKNNLVVSLEESLHTAQSDNANLNNVIASSVQENRTVRKQVEMLEGGTSSAIEVVAKERDEMVDNLAETRKKLEMSQKRLRSQEEDAERTHTMWENDRQKWDVEKRNLDRKIHVVEGRLKTLLSEIEAAQQAHGSMPLGYEAELEDQADELSYGRGSDSRMSGRGTDSRMSGRGTDSRISVRGHSRVNSNGTRDGESRSVRFSNMSMLKGGMLNGASLADELNFDGEEEDAHGEESDQEAGYTSPEALPEEAVHRPRPFSAQSYRESSKARKVLGLSVEGNERQSDEQTRSHSPQRGAKHEDKVVEKDNSSKVLYIDGSTQFSPPSSPILRAQQSSSETTEAAVNECSPVLAEVDQSRQPAVAEQTASKQSSHFPIMPEKVAMVSSSCQTAEQPLSPPDTPKTVDQSTFQPETNFEPVEMKIASTQTTEDDMPPQTTPALTRADTATIMDIPTIAIHPPGTRPSTPQSGVVLPPRTKSASCQASIDLPFSSRSISVQTEEIRVDQRPVKLPAHLLPSAISSNPPSPVPDRSEQRPLAIPPRPTRKPPVIPRIPESPPSEREIRFLDAVSGTTQDAYPGNNDDGPLNNVKESSLRRPIRSGSLFAGFDNAQEGETSAINIADFSDDSAGEKEPIRKTLSKVKNSWKLVPQTQDSVSDRLESSKERNGTPPLPANSNARPTPHEMGKEQALSKMEQEGKLVKRPTPVTPGKQPDIRRAALISSGTAAHSQRQRSPSAPTIPTSELKSSQAPPPPPAPPFPVPTRASSRKLPISISEGAQSPTPQSTSFFSGGQRKDHNRPAIKKPVLRKIRSAAATTSGQPSRDLPRNRSRSPPLTTSTTSILESPRFPHPPPPLPQSHLTSPILHPTTTTTHHKHHRSRSKPSTPTTTITDGSFPQTSVVDAIAQTMVGEWLWKYVRRRKSFGMPESPAAEFENSRHGADFASTSSVTATSGAAASGGVRHKRWVWLAPYERAVMWSSKQPISGSALLGKSGRKRKFSFLFFLPPFPFFLLSSPLLLLNQQRLTNPPQYPSNPSSTSTTPARPRTRTPRPSTAPSSSSRPNAPSNSPPRACTATTSGSPRSPSSPTPPSASPTSLASRLPSSSPCLSMKRLRRSPWAGVRV